SRVAASLVSPSPISATAAQCSAASPPPRDCQVSAPSSPSSGLRRAKVMQAAYSWASLNCRALPLLGFFVAAPAGAAASSSADSAAASQMLRFIADDLAAARRTINAREVAGSGGCDEPAHAVAKGLAQAGGSGPPAGCALRFGSIA